MPAAICMYIYRYMLVRECAHNSYKILYKQIHFDRWQIVAHTLVHSRIYLITTIIDWTGLHIYIYAHTMCTYTDIVWYIAA